MTSTEATERMLSLLRTQVVNALSKCGKALGKCTSHSRMDGVTAAVVVVVAVAVVAPLLCNCACVCTGGDADVYSHAGADTA